MDLKISNTKIPNKAKIEVFDEEKEEYKEVFLLPHDLRKVKRVLLEVYSEDRQEVRDIPLKEAHDFDEIRLAVWVEEKP